ncbi:MAG: DNA polymerase beta domain-containing protein [Parcubacteria group bacterium Gr01-1014_73]|nr:MAG: DNA polymerase beta domain-containing protein [Parcubacteria group bacterium Gr01-1014_73]
MIDIQTIKPKIKELAEKYGLSLVLLFGSQATGAAHGKSDVDIAILKTKDVDKFKIHDDFCDIFKRDDIEIVNMNEASPTMMYVVVRDGKLLYENAPDAFFSWKLYAIWVWLDTAWLRRLRDRKMIEWAKTV